jgi:hypothetical protein
MVVASNYVIYLVAWDPADRAVFHLAVLAPTVVSLEDLPASLRPVARQSVPAG